MTPEKYNKYFNRYYGTQWIKAKLPSKPQVWLMGPYEQSIKKDTKITETIACEIRAHLESDSWIWPNQTVYFFLICMLMLMHLLLH